MFLAVASESILSFLNAITFRRPIYQQNLRIWQRSAREGYPGTDWKNYSKSPLERGADA
jgi:hypothetical protein